MVGNELHLTHLMHLNKNSYCLFGGEKGAFGALIGGSIGKFRGSAHLYGGSNHLYGDSGLRKISCFIRKSRFP